MIAAGILGCSAHGESTQADQASAEERESYRKKIEQLFVGESLMQRNTFGNEPVVWKHEGRKVREVEPSRLVPVTPKLPARKDVVRIEFKNEVTSYWVAETPGEIDRIYEATLRESKEAQKPTTARYFYPDGSSFEAPLARDIFSHACALGLFLFGRDKLLYEISGHPGVSWWELRHSGEDRIHNVTLGAIVQDYCRRSPSYIKAHAND